jgi:hypothetical protein
LLGYFQPVQIRVPQGARIALAMEDSYTPSEFDVALVGMLIGQVYRLQVTDVPNNPGVELYPTVEVIDRLYPPPGLRLRFPIPIELTQHELELAAQGMFVTRVIYIEDPSLALPVRQTRDGEQPWMEVRSGDDPLVVADSLGRPVAVLRIGGRVPSSADAPTGRVSAFGCGGPPLQVYDPSQICAPECPPLEHETSKPDGDAPMTHESPTATHSDPVLSFPTTSSLPEVEISD